MSDDGITGQMEADVISGLSLTPSYSKQKLAEGSSNLHSVGHENNTFQRNCAPLPNNLQKFKKISTL
jgi:hypothetical protein